MKKFALTALGATSMLALAACNTDAEEQAAGGEEPVATAEAGDGDATAVADGAEGTDAEAGTDATAEGATEGEGETGAEGETEGEEEAATE